MFSTVYACNVGLRLFEKMWQLKKIVKNMLIPTLPNYFQIVALNTDDFLFDLTKHVELKTNKKAN